MNKAFLFGYYGMHNAGDNALLLASAWGAKRYFHAEQVTVNACHELKLPLLGSIPSLINEHQDFPGQNRLLQYRAAWQNKHLIFGGGSVFHCARDIQHMRHLCRINQGRNSALGVGLGPFKNTAAEKECKKFLEQCDFVGVRDQQSYEIAKSLSAKANVELTFDLAAILSEIPKTQLHRCSETQAKPGDNSIVVNTSQKDKRRGIAVALCPVERLGGDYAAETYRLKSLARSLALIHALTGEPIYLFDFNGHPTLGDSAVHKQLKNLIPQGVPVIYYYYQSNPALIIEKFKQMRVVLAMRLHAAVFSYLAETPCINLSYHSKCDGWHQQVKAPARYCFDAFKLNEMRLQKELIDGLEYGFDGAKLAISDALRASLKNFDLRSIAMEDLLCVNH